MLSEGRPGVDNVFSLHNGRTSVNFFLPFVKISMRIMELNTKESRQEKIEQNMRSGRCC